MTGRDRREIRAEKLPRHQRKVNEARREVEARVEDLRTALDREFKWLPRGKAWTLPLVGIACGVALALGREKGKGSERRSGGAD